MKPEVQEETQIKGPDLIFKEAHVHIWDSLDTLTLQGCRRATGEPFEVTEGMVRSRR